MSFRVAKPTSPNDKESRVEALIVCFEAFYLHLTVESYETYGRDIIY